MTETAGSDPHEPAGDPHDLRRFVAAQDAGAVYESALAELRAGRKRGHWIWFVFPQLIGLGHSATSRHFAIASLSEARAYLLHPVLGPRLGASTEALLAHPSVPASQLLGGIDALKLRSSMTLFARADPAQELFTRVLEVFFGGQPDPATERLLDAGLCARDRRSPPRPTTCPR